MAVAALLLLGPLEDVSRGMWEPLEIGPPLIGAGRFLAPFAAIASIARLRPRLVALAYVPLALVAWAAVVWMLTLQGRRLSWELLTFGLTWAEALCLGAGVWALGAKPSIARVRALAVAALGLVLLAGVVSRLTPWWSNCSGFTYPPLAFAGTTSAHGLFRPWAALCAATLLGSGAVAERRGARVSLLALALACLATASRDLPAWLAAFDVIDGPERGGRALYLERLALGGTLGEWAIGAAAGVAAAMSLRACFGPGRAGAFAVLRSIAIVLPIGGWALGSVTDPPPSSRWGIAYVEPRWRAHGIEPPVWGEESWAVSFPELESEAWLVDARGTVVERIARPGRPARALQIVADRRAALRPLLEDVSRLDIDYVHFLGRTPSAARLDPAPRARERFFFVELASRDVRPIAISFVVAAPLGRSPPCLEPSWSSHECGEQRHARPVDHVPAQATVADLASLSGALFRAPRGGRRPLATGPPRQESFLPRSRSELTAALAIAWGTCMLGLLVAAWIAWRRAPRSRVDPVWISPRARDTRIASVTSASYREGARPIFVHTARSLLRALALSTWDAVLAVRPWLALALTGLLVWLRWLGAP